MLGTPMQFSATGARLKRKGLSILAAGIAFLVLAGAISVGFLLCRAFVPERITLSGRVVDSSGNPIPSAKVVAVPKLVHSDFSEDPVQTGAVVYSTTCDLAGQFRLERVIVSGGVKEGMWTQPYEIQAIAPGFQLKAILFQRPSRKKSEMNLPDIVLNGSPNP